MLKPSNALLVLTCETSMVRPPLANQSLCHSELLYDARVPVHRGGVANAGRRGLIHPLRGWRSFSNCISSTLGLSGRLPILVAEALRRASPEVSLETKCLLQAGTECLATSNHTPPDMKTVHTGKPSSRKKNNQSPQVNYFAPC